MGGHRSDKERKAMFANMAQKRGKGKIETNRFPIFSSPAIFSTEDQAYLNSLPDVITLGPLVNQGAYGKVYELKGNPDFIVKVPKFHIISTGPKKRELWIPPEMIREWENYQNYNLEEDPLIIPTARKLVNFEGYEIPVQVPVLIRPRLTIISDGRFSDEGVGEFYVFKENVDKLSDMELERLRENLLAFSKKGLFFGDEIQLGIDKHGKAYVYDIDAVLSTSVAEYSKEDPITINNDLWEGLLDVMGKDVEKYSLK